MLKKEDITKGEILIRKEHLDVDNDTLELIKIPETKVKVIDFSYMKESNGNHTDFLRIQLLDKDEPEEELFDLNLFKKS